MTIGLVGRKVGMTRVFTDDGEAIPVTVVEVGGNRVTQIKTPATDGYSAIQVTYGERRPSRVTKAQVGHLAKSGSLAGTLTREFPISEAQVSDLSLGSVLPLDQFQVGQKVDVTGTTLGKGFTGAIKRHHFSSNRASHGNSLSHNSPGSIGMAQDPGRVFPGKRMAGHYGDDRRTTQNLEIVRIDNVRNLLLIKGAVPGSKGGHVVVRPAVKGGA
ncbi:50S ribosomal protein L3 [Ferrovum myxofaciens]|jgi:large subunit ribosomal protein L3|uniref:Large ribosomal subunit protein uL3 n=2 Tax=root TaxID=1 RepID=A0A8F3IJH5_9PROT|nr:50S ribosomal protein L3 [Ferrovum myxofaciens]KXW59091.1 50S ribosomal protein L3 [Ferrovum myxofaciens]MBU6995046.1 50S ribosomal protein L3 [Ferrovum myxofaciens]QKE38844.1 MAG: 50S ribosomal protein L3 [Ferrovum myxofaciens]QKE41430.1 MAG: 50S ribosomal protein L3 [Ferrovum myxofaciens]QWY74054.1 MAG: 50S ribosomal protein L3 [Ferrovum myxofaciens]